jgi:hypothetical protein
MPEDTVQESDSPFNPTKNIPTSKILTKKKEPAVTKGHKKGYTPKYDPNATKGPFVGPSETKEETMPEENIPESEENNNNSEIDETSTKKSKPGLYGKLLNKSKKNVKDFKSEKKTLNNDTAQVDESVNRPTMDQIIDLAINKDAVGFSNAVKTELDYRIDTRLAAERSTIAKNMARTVCESGDPDYYDTQDLKSDELAAAEKHEAEKKAKKKPEVKKNEKK